MQYSTRLPATPLITHDPYFSIWAPGDTPTAEDTVHWSGIRKILRGSILVDGVERGFLSRGLRQAMRCVDTRVTPLSTEYILEDLGVRLSVKFTSPLLLDDLDVLSTPISYIDVDVSFIDGRSHEVEVALTTDAGLCHSGEEQPEMRQDFFSADGLNYAYMGQVRQAPLAGSGDRLTCNWGYLFLASEETLEKPAGHGRRFSGMRQARRQPVPLYPADRLRRHCFHQLFRPDAPRLLRKKREDDHAGACGVLSPARRAA